MGSLKSIPTFYFQPSKAPPSMISTTTSTTTAATSSMGKMLTATPRVHPGVPQGLPPGSSPGVSQLLMPMNLSHQPFPNSTLYTIPAASRNY